MESVFNADFSHVRVHSDAGAAELSNRYNARAFTIGEHVAFGSGEYQPGTLVGDALIAHEMAHVIQQRGASPSVASSAIGDAGYNSLERDADLSAVGAVASLWSKTKGAITDVARNTIPRLKSGLRLSRCPRSACPTQTVTMSAPECGNRYGAVATYCYSGAEGWWFKEAVSMGATNTCQPGANIVQQTIPGVSPKAQTNCIDDLIFNVNGPPSRVAPCTIVTNQTVFAGPTEADVEQCQYHNEQIIEVTETPGSNPKSGKVITTSGSVSTECNWR